MDTFDDTVDVADNNEHFRDGGVQAWRTAIGGFLSFIASIGLTQRLICFPEIHQRSRSSGFQRT